MTGSFVGAGGRGEGGGLKEMAKDPPVTEVPEDQRLVPGTYREGEPPVPKIGNVEVEERVGFHSRAFYTLLTYYFVYYYNYYYIIIFGGEYITKGTKM